MNSEEKFTMENNRYNNSQIYKLVDQVNEYFFTCNSLSKRLSWHKQNAKKEKHKNMKVYKYFNEVGWDNVKIILIEENYLENKQQLLREEDRVIQMYLHDKNCLNSFRAFLSLEDKKEYHKKYREVYNKINKEKINQQNNQNYKDNREKVLQRQKIYYEKNKSKILQRQKEKIAKTI